MIKVTHIDHMGSDLSVVNAARVSFGKKTTWAGQEGGLDDGEGGMGVLKNTDAKLIKYLAKHKHMSPFGHCFASFHIKAPVFVARQLVKHKFLRWNEISRRYVSDNPEFYRPEVWRGNSDDKKQGSSDKVIDTITVSEPDYEYDYMYPEDKKHLLPWTHHTEKVADVLEETHGQALVTYQQLLEAGVCPEQARMVLPQSTMTEWYWSGSLDAFSDMCKLRCKSDTQYETRIVADHISNLMLNLFPESWSALGDD